MKRLVSMALLVAAMLSAGVSASAKARKAEVVVVKKGPCGKEICMHRAPQRRGKAYIVRFEDARRGPMLREFRRVDRKFMKGDPRFRKGMHRGRKPHRR